MPLTDKGREILNQMERDHGSTVTVPVVVAPVAEAADQAKLDAVVGACQAYDQKDASVASLVAEVDRTGKAVTAAREKFRKTKDPKDRKEAERCGTEYLKASADYDKDLHARTYDSATLDDVMAACDAYERKDIQSVAEEMKAQEIVKLMNKRGYSPNEILEKIKAGYEVPQSMDPVKVAAAAYKVIQNKQNIKSMEVRRDGDQYSRMMEALEGEIEDVENRIDKYKEALKKVDGPKAIQLREQIKDDEREIKELRAEYNEMSKKRP